MSASAIAAADVYELSPMQQGMLFHALHAPESGTSFNQLSCRITGPFEPDSFQAAWQRLIDRHAVFRTSFHWQEHAKPVQAVQPHSRLPWAHEDWREIPAAGQRTRWQAFLEQDRAAGFVLDRAPLMRCRLVRLADHEYFFCWSHHHLLSDGWCLNIVMEEVFQVYGHLTQGAPLALPGVRPYRDYIEWLRRQNPEAARQYWSRYLKGFRTPTPMPARAESGDRAGAATEQLQTELSRDVSERLRGFAAQGGLTLSTLVQGAWALLLARYTNETDIVFGTTVSGRPTELPGVERMLGNFISTVPVRVHADPKQALVPWLKMIQARMAARGPFDHTPLSEIQRCSEIPLPAPLFESNVIFMNYPLDASLARGAHGLVLDEISLYDRADVPVELQVTALERWQIELAFDPQRFERDTLQRMLGHIATLLEGFPSHAAQPLGKLPLLSAAERRQIVEEFNSTDVPFDATRTIVHRLEQVAASTPDRIVTECNDVTLTAHELNARANRCAHRLLQAVRLQANDVVAICAHRSERMMVAILAVWKCGAAYLPIDPEYPAQRIQMILDDSRAKLIVAASGTLDASLQLSAPVVHFDEVEDAQSVADNANLGIPVPGDSLAYVIYTSGSTGKPKGAMIEHAGMLNHMLAEVDELAIRPTSAVAQTASHCFDISVWQFFTAPLMGGKTVILDNDVVREPTRFLERVAASRVTVLELVPSYLTLLLERPAAERAVLGQLQVVLITGEMITPALLRRWFALFPDVPAVNAYGPAEASDDIAQHRLEQAPATAYVPVGRPIRNMRIYITDAQMNLCPIGIPGEIRVSGIGVGRGYLNNQSATQAAFVHDPFRPEPGVRLYCTGDTGKFLPDGTLLMLGRKDQQVKIHGHRIELGEVESALSRLEPISQAAVIDHRDDSGHAALCAYIAFRPGATLSDAEIVSALSTVLPQYMVPRTYAVLDQLPLGSNGKIDRKALPYPKLARPSPQSDATPPSTLVEQRLCEIWGEVLGIPAPGIHDNLFALGGDSILSMRIVALAGQAGLKVTTRQIFQHPTVAQLAAVAVAAQPFKAEIVESSGPLPLTPVQKRFFLHNKTDQHHYNQAVLLDVPPDLDPTLLAQACSHAARVHDALRLRFHGGAPGWAQQVSPDLEIPVAAHDIATDRLAMLIERLHASLNLSTGPVFRADLIRLAPGGSARLLLVAHHLIVDAVSWSVLLETLYAAYMHLRTGQSPEAPLGAASWTQWTQAVDRWARSGALEKDLPHWKALADLTPPAMPTDRHAPLEANTVASAEEFVVELSEAATAALLTSAPRAYDAQINDLLLAGLVLTVTHWTGHSGVLLKLESHGREELLPQLDISRTVGWFTGEFPVWLQIDPAHRSPRRAIQAIKTQLRSIPTRGLSYGLLLDELGDAAPWPQLSFNYLGQTAQALSNAIEWKQAFEPAGDGRPMLQQREHLLDINCYVTNGRLRAAVEFSRSFHDRETVRRLAHSYLQALESIVADHRTEPAEAYELTPTQQGMLFHSLYDRASDVYLSSLSGRIDGPLDSRLFQLAWSEIVRRHAVLRTSFHWEGVDQPVQKVHEAVSLPWREEDLSSLSPEAAQTRWQSFLEQDRSGSFTFTHAPLMRLSLFRVSEDSWRFNWTQHHILLDGWSAALLMSEVIAIYDALRNGNDLRLPAPPPFRDYVQWLGQQNFAAAEAFWTQKLQGFATPTPLMLGRPEMEGTARPGKHQEETHQLSAHEAQRLQAFAQAHRLTLNTVAQGAWSLLLSRYSCETDVLHGTVVSGRPAALSGSDRMIGLFINSLPVRVRVPHGPLTPWLQQLQLDLAQQEEYAWFPLANLQKLAALPAGTPLFETLLIFQNYPFEDVASGSLAGIHIAELQVFDPNNYPLTLVVTPGERLTLQALYDSGRFDRETIARLLQHFATLIASFPNAGDRSIRTLPMLGEAEQHRIVHQWNPTSFPIPAEQTVLDFIEAAARAHPRNVAVRCGATVRTYEEICSNSDRIARHLLAAADIQPDDRIAVLMPRSEVMVETILAIWKCGAAYVPIDPAYPAARIESILSGARPKLIVAQAPALANLDFCVPAIDPQRCHDDLPGSELPYGRCVPHSLAYVIFTSGSTGKPKGAMLEHPGMLNHVLCMARELELGTRSVVAQTASHCSDISVWQFFAALVSGGETVIYPDAVVLEPSGLIDRVNQDRVCALQLVPSYLAAVLAELERRTDPGFAHLRTLVTIGETLQPAAVQAWFRLNPGVRLMNAYGPTEASDSVAHYTMEHAPGLPSIPIGKAIQNLRLYIVDPDMNLCPVGVKGEICIAGIGVGRGYLFDEERTHAVFNVDPFHDETPSRLYRSGDIGCLSADGTVLFFGRRDFQVKIRGYRIELGEIETAMTRLEGIQQAVVVTRKDAGGALSLCGYATGSGWNPAQLRNQLRERLPSYMVPDYLMILPELPVTPNGKINRAALPPPDALVQSPVSAAAPANASEAALVRIFADVLGRKTLGVEDDFFDLGGQSLKAIQMLSRIRSELHAGMTVADIFGAPTPRALAMKLARAGAVDDQRIPALPARPWYVASHAQKRIWLASRGAQAHAYTMAGALQIEGPLDADQIVRACDRLVERHESLRTVFAMVKGELRQKVLTREACGFQVERLSLCGELEDVLQQEAQQPFDLATGPLFRAKLLQLTPQTHVLAVTLHHVVADAWSIGVLTQELQELYAGRDLPPLPIQYRDYAEWHSAWLESSHAQAHRAYWHQKLAPPVPRLELPGDFPRPERLTYTGRSLDLTLTGARLSGLIALARTHQTSLYTVVLSSICVLLHRCTGSDDLVIGSTFAGRDHQQLESQIGVFLNTVVLRIPLHQTMTVAAAITAVSHTSSEALEHAGYPFDLLLEELQIRSPANHFPLFDVQVDYIPRLQTQPDSLVTDLSRPDTTTKFDLSLYITEETDRLQVRFIYNTSLFGPKSIEALRARLVRIQDAFLSDPQIPIGRIPLAAPRDTNARKPRVGLRLKP